MGELTGEKCHFRHNYDMLLTGHGDKSVMLLSRWIGLTEEEIFCIRYHMGDYDCKEKNRVLHDKAIKKISECLLDSRCGHDRLQNGRTSQGFERFVAVTRQTSAFVRRVRSFDHSSTLLY